MSNNIEKGDKTTKSVTKNEIANNVFNSKVDAIIYKKPNSTPELKKYIEEQGLLLKLLHLNNYELNEISEDEDFYYSKISKGSIFIGSIKLPKIYSELFQKNL